MLDKNLAKDLKKQYFQKEKERRQIIRLANEVLFIAKKTIFALHRENIDESQEKILEMNSKIQNLEKQFGYTRLQSEGAYQAALEEYVEAICFKAVLDNKKIKKVKDVKLNHVSYIGGLCDLIGEMVRLATNQAAKGNFELVPRLKKQAEDIMSELLEFDFTGYLRTKYDQARGHLRKLEQIHYDLKLRDKE